MFQNMIQSKVLIIGLNGLGMEIGNNNSFSFQIFSEEFAAQWYNTVNPLRRSSIGITRPWFNGAFHHCFLRCFGNVIIIFVFKSIVLYFLHP